MTNTQAQTAKVSGFLFDNRARSLLRRMDPFEVKEAYIWAKKVADPLGLSGTGIDNSRLVKFAPVVALIREDVDSTLGKSLKRAGVSERHIRRLLVADRTDIDEQLSKMVRLLGRKVNVLDLVATSLYWGDKRIRSIAMDYFGIDDDDAVSGSPK